MNVAEVVGEYGTPAYVYDLAEVRRAYAALVAALPRPSRLRYSLKANPHPDVLRTLAQCGCDAEVSSAGEVRAAIDAGFDPGGVLMTGPGKSDEDITTALRHRVRRISVESIRELERIAQLAFAHGAPVDLLVRVNPDTAPAGMGLAMTGAASQFGIDASQLLDGPRPLRACGCVRICGLHLYAGTNVRDPAVLRELLTGSLRLASRLLAALGIAADEVDLGGGFSAPFARRGDRPADAGLSASLEPDLDRHLPGWRHGRPCASFESGRYLTGSCGTLWCRVLDVKLSKGRTFVVLDAGVNQLGGMHGLRRVPPIVPELEPADVRTGRLDDCVVTGPLCTPLDTWAAGIPLPPMAAGDLVRVSNAGAYGLTASLLGFLGHAPAVEVAVDGEEVVSATRLSLERSAAAAPTPSPSKCLG